MARWDLTMRHELVNATLRGKKTQTRRIASHPDVGFIGGKGEEDDPAKWGFGDEHGVWHVLDQSAPTYYGSGVRNESYRIRCPYGEPGHKLVLRESYWHWRGPWTPGGPLEFWPGQEDGTPVHAYGPVAPASPDDGWIGAWARRPSIHMPREYSRGTVELAEVRIERLHAITAGDALAEGIDRTEAWKPAELDGRPFEEKWWDDFHFWNHYPQLAFKNLWDSINGKKCPWDSNPWLWVLTYKLVESSKAAA